MSGHEILDAADRLASRERIDSWTALMRVLISELHQMELPTALEPFLSVAERKWNGELGADINASRVAVWEYIGSEWPSGTDLESPEGRMARALICVLVPEGDKEEQSMTAEWFSAMVGH